MPKREENPFSFKHFLKRDAGTNYSSTGARPKVYSNLASEGFGHVTPESSDSDPGLYSRSATPRHVGTPELTSVLPDFVQDHLVIEQCYLNHSESSNTSQIAVDLENLPDFTLNHTTPASEVADGSSIVNRHRSRQWKKRSDSDVLSSDIPFDLAGTTENQNLPKNVRNGSGSVPLDLSSSDRSPTESIGRLTVHGGGLPFDLPLVSDAKDAAVSASSSGVRSGMQIAEAGVSKSLPDFLSDGPIHSGRHNDVDQPIDDSLGADMSDSISGSQSPDSHRVSKNN